MGRKALTEGLPEKHWRIGEIAERLGISYQTAMKMFEDLEGVKIYVERTGTKTRRKYRMVMVPDSVLQAELRRLER